jgi:seryl-tRNA(Sec) selenium transferase
VAVAPGPEGAKRCAARLRRGAPAIVARIVDERLLFDLRTVLAEDEPTLVRRLIEVVGAG